MIVAGTLHSAFRVIPLCAWLLMIGSSATLAQQIPVPPADFRFDIAKASESIEGTFRIVEQRTYNFALKFSYSTEAQRLAIRDVIGGGSRYVDGRYGEPGIIIPINIVVARADGPRDASSYEWQADTQGLYSHRSAYPGYYMRAIGDRHLSPGLYKFRVETLRATPSAAPLSVDFTVTFDPRFN